MDVTNIHKAIWVKSIMKKGFTILTIAFLVIKVEANMNQRVEETQMNIVVNMVGMTMINPFIKF